MSFQNISLVEDEKPLHLEGTNAEFPEGDYPSNGPMFQSRLQKAQRILGVTREERHKCHNFFIVGADGSLQLSPY
jgi:hypothetical protein